ncbi:SirB2 family protein [Conchiformibius kuhniae]|uniref:SirB2 family protein n=1 Tax=Conchiformibius kuhniae TaxID=211502 RepID=A0A8T9MUX3_9NEIS|nr:SirB2 family protein [Conchiformibius kuhniae]UOP04924.1 SirB2 family protein [Conchiformibius kuhniae]
MYLPLKHSHILLVCISIILFNLKFWLRFARVHRPVPRWLDIIPHANDTLLLCTGAALLHLGKWQPFGAAAWLGGKLVLVCAYIAAGIFCMKQTPRSTRANSAYALCWLLLAATVYLARVKP